MTLVRRSVLALTCLGALACGPAPAPREEEPPAGGAGGDQAEASSVDAVEDTRADEPPAPSAPSARESLVAIRDDACRALEERLDDPGDVECRVGDVDVPEGSTGAAGWIGHVELRADHAEARAAYLLVGTPPAPIGPIARAVNEGGRGGSSYDVTDLVRAGHTLHARVDLSSSISAGGDEWMFHGTRYLVLCDLEEPVRCGRVLVGRSSETSDTNDRVLASEHTPLYEAAAEIEGDTLRLGDHTRPVAELIESCPLASVSRPAPACDATRW